MTLLHSSKRRPAPLEDADYDHEISLVDATRTNSAPRASRSRSPEQPLSASDTDSRRDSDVSLHKHHTPDRLRKELTKRRYKKFQDRRLGESSNGVVEADGESVDASTQLDVEGPEEDGQDRGRPKSAIKPPKAKKPKEPDSEIDILYENQRGGFLCGLPLFASRALGNLDPAPWTNIALKTSATNITNAQVPDPSWEWAWKDWTINHTDEVDEEGWEYSFAFSKKFSWHGPSWWNSFVRRRAWIRKRIKRHSGYAENEAHLLNPDYFTINSAHVRSRSQASSMDNPNRYSVRSLASHEPEEEEVLEDICDIGSLLKALRLARIDREKTEAIENFVEHDGDDLHYLREHMDEIMRMFIFQASRRSLLAHLLKMFNEASKQEGAVDSGGDMDQSKKKRIENLDAAVKAADGEVKKLEFWSDVKAIAEQGGNKGALDESQDWGKARDGHGDTDGKDISSKSSLPENDAGQESEGNGSTVQSESANGKGKGKA